MEKQKTIIFVDELLLPMQFVYVNNILQLPDTPENKPLKLNIIEHILSDRKTKNLFVDVLSRQSEEIIDFENFLNVMIESKVDEIIADYIGSELLDNVSNLKILGDEEPYYIYTNEIEKRMVSELIPEDRLKDLSFVDSLEKIDSLYCHRSEYIKRYFRKTLIFLVPIHRMNRLDDKNLLEELIQTNRFKSISLYAKLLTK